MESEQAGLARIESAKGCLVGLAVGDALGAPLEFLSRDSVRRKYPAGLREMIASSLWEEGEYTDDTQMALLIAESLLERGRIEARDLAVRFHAWQKTAKDVGVMTRAVLNMPDYLENPEECAARHFRNYPDASGGNGAVMRCAPVGLAFLESPQRLMSESRASARATHADPAAQESCAILNLWIARIFLDGPKNGIEEALALTAPESPDVWRKLERIEKVEEGEILSSGFTVHTLEAAAWSFLSTENFEEAVVRAANLGDDADTVAAVCGALAGAYYGYDGILERWRKKLKDEKKILETAVKLVSKAKSRENMAM